MPKKIFRLKRDLNLWDATFYGLGLVIGAGIYVLIGQGAALAGNALWAAFGLAALLASFTGLSYAELSSIFPKAAAEYVYLKNTLETNFLPFLIGWLIITTNVVGLATVALGFAGYFITLVNMPLTIAAIFVIVLFSLVNFYGAKQSAEINTVLVVFVILGLFLIIFLGLTNPAHINYFESPGGLGGIFAAAALVFFAFLGFEDIVNISEETIHCRKTIPRAIILVILITTILYVLVSVSVVNLASWSELGQSPAPLSMAVSNVMPGASVFIALIALFATASTILVFSIVASRMIYGMAEENSIPKIFLKVHPKTGTPWVAILVIAVLSIIFVNLPIKMVASITNFGAFLVFILINASVIILRYRKPHLKRQFKVPLSIGKFPVFPALGILTSFFMIFYLDFQTVIIGLAILLVGAVVYKINRSF